MADQKFDDFLDILVNIPYHKTGLITKSECIHKTVTNIRQVEVCVVCGVIVKELKLQHGCQMVTDKSLENVPEFVSKEVRDNANKIYNTIWVKNTLKSTIAFGCIVGAGGKDLAQLAKAMGITHRSAEASIKFVENSATTLTASQRMDVIASDMEPSHFRGLTDIVSIFYDLELGCGPTVTTNICLCIMECCLEWERPFTTKWDQVATKFVGSPKNTLKSIYAQSFVVLVFKLFPNILHTLLVEIGVPINSLLIGPNCNLQVLENGIVFSGNAPTHWNSFKICNTFLKFDYKAMTLSNGTGLKLSLKYQLLPSSTQGCYLKKDRTKIRKLINQVCFQ